MPDRRRSSTNRGLMRHGLARLVRCAASGVLACAGALSAAGAQAQAFPSRPINIVVPISAGGGADFIARLVAQPLGEKLGQPVLVENRPGADGNIGFAYVKNAAADGHTLVTSYASLVFNPHLNPATVPYKLADFASISHLISYFFVVAVPPSFPAKNLTELVAMAKARPESVTFGDSGPGTLVWIAMLESETGARFLKVPYKGAGPAIQALLGGQVDFILDIPGNQLPHVKAGKTKIIASAQRLAVFPDAQPTSEARPGFEPNSWIGLSAPAAVPKDRVERISREVGAIIRSPDVRPKLDALFYVAEGSTAEGLDTLIRSWDQKFGKLIRDNNIRSN